jgi:phage major head subunit gpT-like protein
MSSILTPTLIREFESRIEGIIVSDYARIARELWVQNIVALKRVVTKKEIFAWLLETADIRPTGDSGRIQKYEDLVSAYTEFTTSHYGDALKLHRDKFNDVVNGDPGGAAFDAAAHWTKQMGPLMALHPQRLVLDFLKTAHTSAFRAYDGEIFFSAAHPLNPENLAIGTYKNLLTGGDAAPIHPGVTMDVAAQNLAKVWAHTMTIPTANGKLMRLLKPRFLFCAPSSFPRAKQLLSADFIAMAAASGGGSADFKAFLASLGVITPIVIPELETFEGGTTYFVACEQVTASDLAGVVYVEREPFRLIKYGELTDAELQRMKELEWEVDGRNAVSGGHPYLLHKVKAS